MKHGTDRRTEESSAKAYVYIVRYLHFMIKVPGAVWNKPLCTLFTMPCLAPFKHLLSPTYKIHLAITGLDLWYSPNKLSRMYYCGLKYRFCVVSNQTGTSFFYTTLWSKQCQQLIRQTVIIVVLPIVCLWDQVKLVFVTNNESQL